MPIAAGGGGARPKPPRKPAPPKKPEPPKPPSVASFYVPPAPKKTSTSSASDIVSSKRKSARSGVVTKQGDSSTASEIVSSRRQDLQSGARTKRYESSQSPEGVARRVDSRRATAQAGGRTKFSEGRGAKQTYREAAEAEARGGYRAGGGTRKGARTFGGTSGGTSTRGDFGGGADSFGTRRFTSTDRDIPRQGATDNGRLAGSFKDRDLVGSGNSVDDFDGSSLTYGGSGEVVGDAGGGGTGSSTFGRESVGLAGDLSGQSLEEVVYGVRKKGKKVRRPRSL